MLKPLKTTLSLISFKALISCSMLSFNNHLEKADTLKKRGDYLGANHEYREHVAYRLSQDNLPKWENPYFYYLIIGDNYLAANKPKEALSAYSIAEFNKVSPSLVGDRFLRLAEWLEEKGDFASANIILDKYSSYDPVIYNGVKDRIARKIVDLEDKSGGIQSSQNLASPRINFQPTPAYPKLLPTNQIKRNSRY
jgi:hypothetical protein